jgi:putative ABC transport system permease protein
VSGLWLLARRQLARHGLRAALTAAGVACGVALVVAIRVVNASTLAAFTGAIEDLAGTAALQVRGPGPFPDAVAERVGAVRGVTHAVPIVTSTFFAVDGDVAGEGLSVFAADVSDGHAVRTLKLVQQTGDRVVDDPLAFLVDPYSVVLTDVFAARAGVAKNGTIRLRTPVGIRTFTVRGILPPGGVGRAFGGDLLLMDVVGAQVVLGLDRTIDEVDVTLAPGVRVEDTERAIAAVLDPGLEVVPPARRGEQIEGYLRSFRTLLSGVSGLALLAAVFLVGTTIATSVAARRREIGQLRCTGATRTYVLRLVLGEATLLGLAGTLVGVPVGILLARLLLHAVNESTALIFSLRTFTSGLEVTPETIAVGVAVGLGATLAAGWPPARQATRVSPLAAVRAEPPGAASARWPDAGTIAVASLVATAALWAETRFDSAWAGNVAALAADVALAGVVVRAAGRVADVLFRPFRGRLGVAGQLVQRRLVALPAPLALAAGVLALGLGLMLMSATLARSFEDSVLDFIRRQVRADLVVASTATTGWVESPVDEAIGSRLAAMPGVARVERLRLAEHDHHGVRISIDSLDASAFAPERADDFNFTAGDPAAALAAVRDGTGVLVSQNLARQLALAVGSVLPLDTPAGTFTPRVAGVVVDYVSPRGSVILTRDVYQRWWRDTGVTRFHLTLAPDVDPSTVRRTIAAGVGAAEGLKVLTQRELYAYHQGAVRRAFRFTHAVETLPLVVAAFGLAEALLAVSYDRRRELALLRAAGATRGQMVRAVVGEAVGVGALGLVGGVGVGLVLALLWVRVNFVHQIGWEIDLHFAPGSLPAAAFAALGVSVPAALGPARRVARLPVLDALRDG